MFTLNVKWEKVSNTTTANKTSKSTQHDRFTGVAGHLRLAGIPFKNTPEDFDCEMFQAEVGRNKSEILRPEWGWWGRDTGKTRWKQRPVRTMMWVDEQEWQVLQGGLKRDAGIAVGWSMCQDVYLQLTWITFTSVDIYPHMYGMYGTVCHQRLLIFVHSVHLKKT